VRCDDTYWLFSTGHLFSSWHSTDLVEWQRGPSVFREIPAWVRDVVTDQRGHFWAPDVITHNGRFLLYYSVSSFGKNTSAITLATATSLNPESDDYGWTDQGIVIQSTATDDFNAIGNRCHSRAKPPRAADCKSAIVGSTPTGASFFLSCRARGFDATTGFPRGQHGVETRVEGSPEDHRLHAAAPWSGTRGLPRCPQTVRRRKKTAKARTPSQS
jgi:beta-xylosidase